MKKHAGIDTLTNLLWISFGLMGGFSYYSKEDYWISGVCSLLAVLYGYKLFRSQRKKWRSRGK